MDVNEWLDSQKLTAEKLEIARAVLEVIREGTDVFKAVRRYPLEGGGYLSKANLVAAYTYLVEHGEWTEDREFLDKIKMKPVRTLSGVTTVTILTKPYPCPGNCIFCPTEVQMPKSYLSDEPGAMRGVQNQFDPFRQVASRIQSLTAVGHPTDKIELLILGGSWTAYPRTYQEEFIRRCFDALNLKEASTIEEAQHLNETASHRNVGLVIETRPDEITPEELVWLRHLGVTKVQMGAQSLDDRILAINHRGHRAADTLRATALLRAAGFKIVLHWMPNLLGATPETDRQDFRRLFADLTEEGGYAPDEIKIYPTQLLENTGLYEQWKQGNYQPYSQETLIQLIADVKEEIPSYCRINRVIRDIPAPHVIAGNRRSSLRQDVLAELARRGKQCGCIRCREVRGKAVDPLNLHLEDLQYQAAYAEEHFLHFRTPQNQIAGYLRLSLPNPSAPDLTNVLPDLIGAAIIREVHIYGQSLQVGEEKPGSAQHVGLGTRLIEESEKIARQAGYPNLAVISAVGTRIYYEKRGFQRRSLYLVKPLV
ncbi:MAG TPA: tRNA uridine(34) 5-carboxymethylaminomethyl modification radical SAM/GNAT enzyme Elp3 [Anaerolineaceae bacterium]